MPTFGPFVGARAYRVKILIEGKANVVFLFGYFVCWWPTHPIYFLHFTLIEQREKKKLKC